MTDDRQLFDLETMKARLYIWSRVDNQPARLQLLVNEIYHSLPDKGTPESVCIQVNRLIYELEQNIGALNKPIARYPELLIHQLPLAYQNLRNSVPDLLRLAAPAGEFRRRVEGFYGMPALPLQTLVREYSVTWLQAKRQTIADLFKRV